MAATSRKRRRPSFERPFMRASVRATHHPSSATCAERFDEPPTTNRNGGAAEPRTRRNCEGPGCPPLGEPARARWGFGFPARKLGSARPKASEGAGLLSPASARLTLFPKAPPAVPWGRRGRWCRAPPGLEGHRHTRYHPHFGLRLDPILVVDNGNAHGNVARPVVLGKAQPRCQEERIAPRVLVRDAAFHLLGVPLAVQLQYQVKPRSIGGFLMH